MPPLAVSAFGAPSAGYGDDEERLHEQQHGGDDDDDDADDDDADVVVTTAGARRTQQQQQRDDEAPQGVSWRDLVLDSNVQARVFHVALFASIVYGLVQAAPSIKFVE